MQTATENALIRQEPASLESPANEATLVFDAESKNRFEFTVRDGAKKYETAHVFGSLSDERYMQWLRGFKIRGNDDDVSEEAREASVALWDDVIVAVEKIRYPEGADWKALISAEEKIEAINQYLAVAIGEDIVLVKEDRELGMPAATQTVLTETFFNGQIVVQSHDLKVSTFEMQKKYGRIQSKRFKPEPTRGLRRKAKIEFIPQDDKFGDLYDEMFVSSTGFEGGRIPLRFKTTVVHHLFEEKLDQKKFGR